MVVLSTVVSILCVIGSLIKLIFSSGGNVTDEQMRDVLNSWRTAAPRPDAPPQPQPQPHRDKTHKPKIFLEHDKTTPIEALSALIPEIEEKLEYKFKDRALLQTAFTHSSFANENPQLRVQHNERLEFLGDAVLGMIISDFLYENFPTKFEGELSTLRDRLVNATSCKRFIEKLQVGEFMVFGKGQQGLGKGSASSDLFEAVLAAIYLDAGHDVAEKFVLKFFTEDFQKMLNNRDEQNWKALLQEHVQRNHGHTQPIYSDLVASGPDHRPTFRVAVRIGDREVLGIGEGASKKDAQQAAAKVAVDVLRTQRGENL